MIHPARIPPAEALFLGEALAPLLSEIEAALSDSHPTLCSRFREALDEQADAPTPSSESPHA